MPTPIKYKAPFLYNQYYHLVFKSIDGLWLFKTDADRKFFLDKFSFFLKPFLNCTAYCLLDNHVHLIIGIVDKTSFHKAVINVRKEKRTISMNKFLFEIDNTILPDEIIERQANSFMISYVKRYNDLYQRSGSIFQSPFRRTLIQNESHLQQAIIYVHANAQKHKLTNNFSCYKYSSYREILEEKSEFIDTTLVLKFFGDRQNLITQHEQQVAHYYKNNWPNSKIEYD